MNLKIEEPHYFCIRPNLTKIQYASEVKEIVDGKEYTRLHEHLILTFEDGTTETLDFSNVDLMEITK